MEAISISYNFTTKSGGIWVRPMIGEHQILFCEGTLESCGTDKGYYSGANRKYLASLEGLGEFCLQQPSADLKNRSESEAQVHARLVDCRSGIEPLIGHAKHGGQLGRSRMKTDDTTLAAGYSAIGGFNLRQLARHLMGKEIKVMGEDGPQIGGRDWQTRRIRLPFEIQ